jgi:clan AA aspartic protease
MGLVYAEIELFNTEDIGLVNRGYLKSEEIRKTKVRALVDSGAYMLCLNERIVNQLGLRFIMKQTAQLANGAIEDVDIVGPVEVKFLNRSTSCRAMVIPGDNEVLLGAIPMEDMDVIIDPRDQQLKLPPDRPYMAQKSLK